MFAASPQAFASSRDLVPLYTTIATGIDIMARGLQTKTTICLTREMEEQHGLSLSSGGSFLFVPLNCQSSGSGDDENMFDAILLAWTARNNDVRVQPDPLSKVNEDRISRDTTVFMVKEGGVRVPLPLPRWGVPSTIPCAFFIQLPDVGVTLLNASPIQGRYDYPRSMLFMPQTPSELLNTGQFRGGFGFDVGDSTVFLLVIEVVTMTTLSASYFDDTEHVIVGYRIFTCFYDNRVKHPSLRQGYPLLIWRLPIAGLPDFRHKKPVMLHADSTFDYYSSNPLSLIPTSYTSSCFLSQAKHPASIDYLELNNTVSN
ncbi:uncharacterized protein Z519_12652 [Cladophialophora bantiana CBS 173.52]|uniref:Uncharacterized protein n=1 Tax=Cladophialophora bantiana (strain ATCC 10958 / CBS 173.52 / CDC B-1940 / NIH 8579) TaxID=1442370 RepID=A0A0D2HQM9_CLAB1|nr:uncharacterized protein Z519_12652 [Cladophialophora bantiana CBS 173.52]KIW86739.1 hypothetical protein Z519_12652 [Cladophialophora bantiana CBS 173.52]